MTTVLSDLRDWVELPADLGIEDDVEFVVDVVAAAGRLRQLLSGKGSTTIRGKAPDAQGPVSSGHPALPGALRRGQVRRYFDITPGDFLIAQDYAKLVQAFPAEDGYEEPVDPEARVVVARTRDHGRRLAGGHPSINWW